MNEYISILQGYIDHLEHMRKIDYELFDREQADKDIEAFKAAIKALEQEDWKFYYDHGYAQAKRDLEQEPCEDAISRQEY